MESDGIVWEEIMDLVNSEGDINLSDLRRELDIEEKNLKKIISRLEKGGIDVLTEEEEEVKERINNKSQQALRQTDEPIKLYLREIKNICLLTREGECSIGSKMERGRKMISKYLFRSIPVISEFLSYKERLESASLPIEQFLYLNNHQWSKGYNGYREKQSLKKIMKKVRKWRAGLIKYKDVYVDTGRERYKLRYKRYEKRIIDEIQTLRIQTPYLKRMLKVQKGIYNRQQSMVDAIDSMEAKLHSRIGQDKGCIRIKDSNDDELIRLGKAVESRKQALKDFNKEIHANWDEVKSRMKKIQKWEEYFLKAKRQLIEANICLVIAIAKKYFRRGVDFMDAVQEGNTGLIKAVEKFDHLKGYKFSTYGIWWIKQAIAKALAEQHDTIRIPVHAVAVINKIKKVQHNWVQENGVEPSLEEISEMTGFSMDKIRIARELDHGSLSLEDPATGDEEVLLGDVIPDTDVLSPAKNTCLTLIGEYLEEALNTALSPREKKVLQLRFGLIDGNQKTLEDVGLMFNVTRERIRQIEANALRKMRRCNQRRKLEEFLRLEEFEAY